MKRLVLLLAVLLFLPLYSYAAPYSKPIIYGAVGLTGGTTNYLDAIDHTGVGSPNTYDLSDGDSALVSIISGTSTDFYVYVYDVDGTQAENSPLVIRPDDQVAQGPASSYPGNWILASHFTQLDSDADGSIADESWTINSLTIGADDVLDDGDIGVTVESRTSNDIDPDRLNGDTVDDNLVDPGILNITSMDISVDYDLLSSNETFSGIPTDGIDAGETVTKWQLVYYDTTATEWLLSDADAAGEWPAWGITVEAGNDGDEVMILTRGLVRYDTWDWTPGDHIYLSDTPGGLLASASKPATTDDCLQIVGRAITADIVWFDFNPMYGYTQVP